MKQSNAKRRHIQVCTQCVRLTSISVTLRLLISLIVIKNNVRDLLEDHNVVYGQDYS